VYFFFGIFFGYSLSFNCQGMKAKTGLAFASVGLLTMKFLAGLFYFGVGILFIILSGLLILEFGKRYGRFRKAVRLLRDKEAQLGFDIGEIR